MVDSDARAQPRPITRDLLRALPKAELHVHLDGSLRPSTLLELARARGVPLPAADAGELERRLVASDAGSLERYLVSFELTVAVMQDAAALERIAYELAADACAEGVRYLEVRYCPALNTRGGLTLGEAVEAPLRGLARAGAEFGVQTTIIVCALRHLEPSTSLRLAELAARYRGRGVAGFDLAGPERGHPARDHREAFALAGEAGLGLTVHAGEAAGPDSIREALDDCRAHRIGHGTRLGDDPDLLARVRDAGTPLEVCITSNVQTGAVDSYASHPVRGYLARGVAVTLNTDNRLISGTTLTDELWKAHHHLGFGWPELLAVTRASFQHAFLPAVERQRLLATFDRDVRSFLS
jgi:adenosine deaminase